MAATRERRWLLVPALAACAADVTMTLLFQNESYWRGDYAAVVEFNPLARVLLRHHPLAFGAAALVSSALVGVGLFAVNIRLAAAIAFAVTFCHSVAAAAWMLHIGWPGVAAAVLLLFATERLLSLSWRNAGVSPD